MARTTIYCCDFEGCCRALSEDDVAHVHLDVHHHEMTEEIGAQSMCFGLDLCDEHLDVVVGRILTSNSN